MVITMKKERKEEENHGRYTKYKDKRARCCWFTPNPSYLGD
jgi:hypothetical protein